MRRICASSPRQCLSNGWYTIGCTVYCYCTLIFLVCMFFAVHCCFHPSTSSTPLISLGANSSSKNDIYRDCVCKLCIFFFGRCSPKAEVFCLVFCLRGMQSIRSYIMMHVWVPAELRGACFELSKSLNWLLCQWVAFRLAELSRRMETMLPVRASV